MRSELSASSRLERVAATQITACPVATLQSSAACGLPRRSSVNKRVWRSFALFCAVVIEDQRETMTMPPPTGFTCARALTPQRSACSHTGAGSWRSGVVALRGSGSLALVVTESATIASVLTDRHLHDRSPASSRSSSGFRTRSWGRVLPVELGRRLSTCVAGVFAISSPVAGLRRAHAAARRRPARHRRRAPRARLRDARRASRGAADPVAASSRPCSACSSSSAGRRNSLFILGTLLGIDLLFYGMTWIVFGAAARGRHG